MKKISIILVLALFYSTAYAGEIYTYTDKDGNIVVSNNPVPDQYQHKAKKVEAFTPLTQTEREKAAADEQAIQQRKIRAEKAEARNKAEIDYYNKKREQEEERIAESKRKREESRERLKKAQEENHKRRFFTSKSGEYSP